MALSGCLKDGVEAPASGTGSAVDVRFDFHCDGRPFDTDSLYTDGFGTLVRFERFRLLLVGADLLSNEGLPMGTWPGSVLLADLTAPDRRIKLPAPASGEAHWLRSRFPPTGERIQGADSLWITCADDDYQAMLDISGTMDSNDDGRIDSTDERFRIIAAPDSGDPMLTIHAHALVPSDGTGVLVVPVNLRNLLHDIDLPDEPITMGHGPYATQALNNLRTRVLGDDNKPQ